jgi:phosphoribosylglycinamide formyltransferase 1
LGGSLRAIAKCFTHNMAVLKKLGILLSGRGSNFEAIADSVKAGKLHAEIAIVISNRADAPGLESAKQRGLNAQLIPSKGRVREEHDADVIMALKHAKVDLICLAGYMRLLSPDFIRAFPHRIINIHPSLLPAFPGMDAQKQALEYGAKVTGCTVHFVDEHLDHGPIMLQKTVPVLDGDDVHSLSARILEQEHTAYSEAIGLILSGEIEVIDRRVLRKRAHSEGR